MTSGANVITNQQSGILASGITTWIVYMSISENKLDLWAIFLLFVRFELDKCGDISRVFL